MIQYDNNEIVELKYKQLMEKTLVARFIFILSSVIIFLAGGVMVFFYDIYIGSIALIFIAVTDAVSVTLFYQKFNRRNIKKIYQAYNYYLAIDSELLMLDEIYESGKTEISYSITQINRIVKHKFFVEIITVDNRIILAKNDEEFYQLIGNFLAENSIKVVDRT